MDRHCFAPGPDPDLMSEAFPVHLTAAQALARIFFDLCEAMASLPPKQPYEPPQTGGAGVRLRGDLTCSLAEDLLREFARQELGCRRISAKYLAALRVVLGNQAKAERDRYSLEMNIRTTFAPERVMRTIIDQMREAGITAGVQVSLGAGKTQTVQCFNRRPTWAGPRVDLNTHLREEEAMSDWHLRSVVWPQPEWLPPPEEVPH